MNERSQHSQCSHLILLGVWLQEQRLPRGTPWSSPSATMSCQSESRYSSFPFLSTGSAGCGGRELKIQLQGARLRPASLLQCVAMPMSDGRRSFKSAGMLIGKSNSFDGSSDRLPIQIASLLLELPHGLGVINWPQGCYFSPQVPPPALGEKTRIQMQLRGWEGGVLFTPTPFPEHPCEQQQVPACCPQS